ncbi:zinc-ribbon domain-containing protein [Lujinxingia vulgaris]|uniref:Zinc-ribbon domain-containing protein n=1 Tax=Lujinxingia vulgaris TaxID=2600176 RepID=A0A5C6X6U0_9DELT|nr:zinc ribbon domain-containing protein [Lujinxingia vulgaris]TXD35969.1 zinc-ribbon domain-containing protein [Lujinxingia vulgaris]
MNICPNCGKEVDDNARHCGHCGHKLQLDQKKTMLGMAAIDPQELQKRIAEARPADREEPAPEEGQPDSPSGAGPAPEMAPTEVMEPIRLPKPDSASAPTEPPVAQDEAEPDDAHDESDFATGPTQAMPSLTRPTPATDGPQERADDQGPLPTQPTGPMEALPTGAPSDEPGEWDARDLPDPLAATELEMSPVDLSKTGPSATPDADVKPASEPASDASEDRAPGGAQVVVDDAPSTPTDAPALTPTPAQGLAAQLPENLARLTEDPENKKRLMLFVGAVAVVLLGCCILSAVLSFMF